MQLLGFNKQSQRELNEMLANVGNEDDDHEFVDIDEECERMARK